MVHVTQGDELGNIAKTSVKLLPMEVAEMDAEQRRR